MAEQTVNNSFVIAARLFYWKKERAHVYEVSTARVFEDIRPPSNR